MNDTQLQELQKISDLQTAFTDLYIFDGNTFKPRLGKGKNVYDSKRRATQEKFEDGLNLVGINPKLTPKQIELELQQKYEELYELLKKTPKFAQADRPNDMPAKTTLDATESADLIEQAEKRAQQNANIRAREKQAIEDYIKQNEERIVKAKSLQEKLKDKVVYAKVVIPEEEKLTQDEQKELEVLVAKAKNDTPVVGKVLTPKQELIDDFTLEIEKKLEPVLKDLPEKEKEIIARTYAVEIVEKIANPEAVVDERVQTVILDNIAKPKQQVVTKILQKDDELITLAKNGAVLIATKQNDDFSALEKITANLVGPKIASKILGKQNYQVTFSEEQLQGETTHTVRFGELNQQNIHELSQENVVLTTLQQHGQQFGYDKINSVFTTYLKGKVDSLPAGSVIKKAYKDPIVQSIFARYGMAEPVVWQAVGQSRFVGLVMKVTPDTAGPVLGLVGKITGKQIVVPIATKVAGQVAVKTGVTATLSTTLAAAGAAIPVPVLNVILAAAGWVIGELFSKAQIWFKKNKDKVAPILGVGAAGLLAPFFGAGPAVLGGVGAFALFGGSIAGLATGAFGVLGLIGRSVGIAIATPVIVTLLVLPPLIAFIMLVINNSAYVVPPSPYSSSLNGGADNPYMLVTKTANPTKLDNSSSNQTVIYVVSIKALKGNLTNLKLVSTECSVIKKDKSKVECPTEFVPDLDGSSVAPGNEGVFSFTGIYDSKYSDSLIRDTVTVSATNEAGEEITTSGSASVCMGECPANCAVVSDNADNWSTTKLAENVNIALGELSQYQGFTAKLCPDNEPINLCYRPSKINPGNYAWHVSNYYKDNCDIYFNEKGIGSEKDALFMITHELTHHIQAISSEHELSYSISGAWIPEIVGKGLCTYSATNGVSLEAMREGMAEAAALYTNSSPSWDVCASNYSSKYPRNYNWAKKFMEE